MRIRKSQNKKWCGVLAGIAASMGIDPFITRMAWFVFSLLNPIAGLLIYGVASTLMDD